MLENLNLNRNYPHFFILKPHLFDKNRFTTSSRIFLLRLKSKYQIFLPEKGIKVLNHMKLTTIF